VLAQWVTRAGSRKAVGKWLGYDGESASQTISKAIQKRPGVDMARRVDAKLTAGLEPPVGLAKKQPQLVRAVGENGPLEDVLEQTDWSALRLTPDESQSVVRMLRAEFFKATEAMPRSYWRSRLETLSRELSGVPKLIARPVHAESAEERDRKEIETRKAERKALRAAPKRAHR
jgi:hypothetical protein